ncbi:hypothetical protein PLEOSDRAFT_36655 [Pleurotus ostreatus PC15]|uniref:Uncharacterized protein n=1 Tax=Pleurotus ostreatus (strain PC15) TaxID=1137138 RepID=A0A067N4D5_PLEO1|nr:hypothetical protein PLEOSDRAFT_36655 [Pleurotus ostreatus PC15]
MDIRHSDIRSADPTIVKVFESQPRGHLQPSLDDFRPDLCVSLTSAWNKRLAQLFARRFVNSVEYECKDKYAVEYTFMQHLHQLRNLYEDQRAVHDHQYEVQRDDLKTDKAAEHRRSEACKVFAKRDERLRGFLPLWDSLPLEAMSGDESDHRPKNSKHYSERYIITTLPWRSNAPEVKNWFRGFDALHMSTRFLTDDRPGPGRFPHIRIDSTRLESKAPPVPGLPTNFYNPSFLAGLDPLERDQLNIQPSVDLRFSRRIQL